jgi:hypothetical protein
MIYPAIPVFDTGTRGGVYMMISDNPYDVYVIRTLRSRIVNFS